MTSSYTRRIIWAFGIEAALILGTFVWMDSLPGRVLMAMAVTAICLPVTCFFALVLRRNIRIAWQHAIAELWSSFVAEVRFLCGLLNRENTIRFARRIVRMKAVPATADDWFALLLLPFKTYVLITLPIVRLCHALGVLGDLSRRLYYSEVLMPVEDGCQLCLLILLVGALLQAMFSKRGYSTRTVLVFLLGIAMMSVP